MTPSTRARASACTMTASPTSAPASAAPSASGRAVLPDTAVSGACSTTAACPQRPSPQAAGQLSCIACGPAALHRPGCYEDRERVLKNTTVHCGASRWVKQARPTRCNVVVKACCHMTFCADCSAVHRSQLGAVQARSQIMSSRRPWRSGLKQRAPCAGHQGPTLRDQNSLAGWARPPRTSSLSADTVRPMPRNRTGACAERARPLSHTTRTPAARGACCGPSRAAAMRHVGSAVAAAAGAARSGLPGLAASCLGSRRRMYSQTQARRRGAPGHRSRRARTMRARCCSWPPRCGRRTGRARSPRGPPPRCCAAPGPRRSPPRGPCRPALHEHARLCMSVPYPIVT